MDKAIHPLAVDHLPPFVSGPGGTDVLFNVMVVVLIAMILLLGTFYFRLHALPERMAHRANRTQIEIVAVLGLISLFTHNHLFWIAGLILAMIQFPDFRSPVVSIAASLERIAGRYDQPSRERVVDSIQVDDVDQVDNVGEPALPQPTQPEHAGIQSGKA